MGYKVNCTRSEGETGSYDLSYGKGSKKLTAKLIRMPDGKFQAPSGSTGMKRQLIAEWEEWAIKAYGTDDSAEPDVPDAPPVAPIASVGPPSHQPKGPPGHKPKASVVAAKPAELPYVSSPLFGGIMLHFPGGVTVGDDMLGVHLDKPTARGLAEKILEVVGYKE